MNPGLSDRSVMTYLTFSGTILQCAFHLRPLLNELLTVYALVKSMIGPNVVQNFEAVNRFGATCFYAASHATIICDRCEPYNKVRAIFYNNVVAGWGGPSLEEGVL